jgi:hypothetical protein
MNIISFIPQIEHTTLIALTSVAGVGILFPRLAFFVVTVIGGYLLYNGG